MSEQNSIFYTINSVKNQLHLNSASSPDETKYNLVSFLHSKRKPDVYLGKNVITARNYHILSQTKPSESQEEKINSSLHEEEDDYNELKKQDIRYFSTGNITIKCYNCGEVGHKSHNCPNDIVLTCIKCNQSGHTEFECPHVKCFKCNRLGHKSAECKVSSQEIEKCERCKNIGHRSEDCLIIPVEYDIKTINKFGLTCYFCNSTRHLLCPLLKSDCFLIDDYMSDEVILTESEDNVSPDDFYSILKSDTQFSQQSTGKKRKPKRIFRDISNKEIHKKVFCPKCGDRHSMKQCHVKTKENAFDIRRQMYSKVLFRNSQRRRKDKTVVIMQGNKEDGKHIEQKKNYYDEDNSSGESFAEVLRKHQEEKGKYKINRVKYSEEYTKHRNKPNRADHLPPQFSYSSKF